MPLRSPTPKGRVSKPSMFLLIKRRPSWCQQGGHFYLRLFLLSRKASDAITKLPKAISKASIPMKIEFYCVRHLLSQCNWISFFLADGQHLSFWHICFWLFEFKISDIWQQLGYRTKLRTTGLMALPLAVYIFFTKKTGIKYFSIILSSTRSR